MATGQFTEPQLREPLLNGEGFAESSLDATHSGLRPWPQLERRLPERLLSAKTLLNP